jgi:MFS family permease
MSSLRIDRARLTQGMFAPLKNADYRRLLTSNGLWWGIIFMESTAMGWLVLDLTDSIWMVSLAGFCRSAPFPILGFVNGPLIDRFGRRKVIVTAQMVNFMLYLALSILLWLGKIAFWHLVIGALVAGTTWALEWPARRTLMPDLVGKALTLDAMLLENMVQSISRVLGPATAGVLIAGYGVRGCYTFMALLATLTLAIVHSLAQQPIPRQTLRPQMSPWTLIGETLRYAGQHQAILGVLLVTVVMNIFVFPYMSLLSVFARDVLHQGPVGLGLLGTGSGLGAFAGLYLINRLRERISHGWIFAIGTSFMCLALFAFALSTLYPLSWSMLLLVGIGQACFGSMQSSIILLIASDEMRSRAMGALVLAISADPLGKLQTGYLAERWGAPVTVATQACAAIFSIATIVLLLPGLRTPTTGPTTTTISATEQR